MYKLFLSTHIVVYQVSVPTDVMVVHYSSCAVVHHHHRSTYYYYIVLHYFVAAVVAIGSFHDVWFLLLEQHQE